MAITNRADWDAAIRKKVRKTLPTSNYTIGPLGIGMAILNEGVGNNTTGLVPAAGMLATLPAGAWLIEDCTVGCSGNSATYHFYEKLYQGGPWTPTSSGDILFSGQTPTTVLGAVPEGNLLGLEGLLVCDTSMGGNAFNLGANFLAGDSATLVDVSETLNLNTFYTGAVLSAPLVPIGISTINRMWNMNAVTTTGSLSIVVARPLFSVSLPPGVHKKKFSWDISGFQKVTNTSALMVVAANDYSQTASCQLGTCAPTIAMTLVQA